MDPHLGATRHGTDPAGFDWLVWPPAVASLADLAPDVASARPATRRRGCVRLRRRRQGQDALGLRKKGRWADVRDLGVAPCLRVQHVPAPADELHVLLGLRHVACACACACARAVHLARGQLEEARVERRLR